MPDYVNVALDAMGGDNAPDAVIEGAALALSKSDRIRVYLVGQEEVIRDSMKRIGENSFHEDRVVVVDAREVIEMAESPVHAIARKRDSSIVKGLALIKDGLCDAFVSAGSTGAVLVGGQTVAGRIPGVKRAPIAALLPTAKGVCLLLDSGANVDARSDHMVQFAQLGSMYMEAMQGVKNPKVGLVNLGAEEEKGNALVKETMPLLKEIENLNFVGSVETRDIPAGAVDVAVCEAFTGNAILKTYEGAGKLFMGTIKEALMSSFTSKIGALLIKNSLKNALSRFDTKSHGGAPLLGLKGLVMKTHGSSGKEEVCNSILQAITFKDQELVKKMTERIGGV